MSTVKSSEAEFMIELATRNGVSCATTSDGHVLIFKVTALEELIKQANGKELVTVFIKRPDMATAVKG